MNKQKILCLGLVTLLLAGATVAERYSCGPFAFTNESRITYPQFSATSGYLHRVTFEITDGFSSEEIIWDNDSTNSRLLDVTLSDYYSVWSEPGAIQGSISNTITLPIISTNWPPILYPTNIIFPPVISPIISTNPPFTTFDSEEPLMGISASESSLPSVYRFYGNLFQVDSVLDRMFDGLEDGDGAGVFNGGLDEIITEASLSNISNEIPVVSAFDLAQHTGDSTRMIQVQRWISTYMLKAPLPPVESNSKVEFFRTNGVYSGEIWIHYDYESQPLQPALKDVSWGNGQFSFGVDNLSMHSSNVVQYTDDLVHGEWQDVDLFIGRGSQTNWMVPLATNTPARYYRIRSR